MLFAPPRPPVRLSRDCPVVIGRSRSCGLPVPAGTASRRHAEVRFEHDQFVVQDLGSTNGTFVNGERVGAAHALTPGDRIDVGGTQVTFCEVEGSVEVVAPQEGQTLLMSVPQPAPSADAFRGRLTEIPAFAVLQVLEIGRKTGVLAIEGGARCGRVWLAEGAPVHAETDGAAGFEAALALALADDGHFAFEPDDAAPDQTIGASVTELLLEASCAADKERAEG